MKSLDKPIQILIRLRSEGQHPVTLLAVCLNSVTETVVKVAADHSMPILFAAALNQVIASNLTDSLPVFEQFS